MSVIIPWCVAIVCATTAYWYFEQAYKYLCRLNEAHRENEVLITELSEARYQAFLSVATKLSEAARESGCTARKLEQILSGDE